MKGGQNNTKIMAAVCVQSGREYPLMLLPMWDSSHLLDQVEVEIIELETILREDFTVSGEGPYSGLLLVVLALSQ